LQLVNSHLVVVDALKANGKITKIGIASFQLPSLSTIDPIADGAGASNDFQGVVTNSNNGGVNVGPPGGHRGLRESGEYTATIVYLATSQHVPGLDFGADVDVQAQAMPEAWVVKQDQVTSSVEVISLSSPCLKLGALIESPLSIIQAFYQ
jgi:hypothetical protein